jgi:hypothetical protein
LSGQFLILNFSQPFAHARAAAVQGEKTVVALKSLMAATSEVPYFTVIIASSIARIYQVANFVSFVLKRRSPPQFMAQPPSDGSIAFARQIFSNIAI